MGFLADQRARIFLPSRLAVLSSREQLNVFLACDSAAWEVSELIAILWVSFCASKKVGFYCRFARSWHLAFQTNLSSVVLQVIQFLALHCIYTLSSNVLTGQYSFVMSASSWKCNELLGIRRSSGQCNVLLVRSFRSLVVKRHPNNAANTFPCHKRADQAVGFLPLHRACGVGLRWQYNHSHLSVWHVGDLLAMLRSSLLDVAIGFMAGQRDRVSSRLQVQSSREQLI
jgi:hypothetical protein